MPSLHRHTPTLSVIDPRNLPVRSITWCRSAPDTQAEARVHRARFDAAGREVAQWDPRLWARWHCDPSTPANLQSVYTLPGAVLGTVSVDAGWRVSLLGDAGQLMHSWDGRGSEQRNHYDALLRPTALFVKALNNDAFTCISRYGYGAVGADSALNNQCGRVIRHDDLAGTRFFPVFGLLGGACELQQHFLKELNSVNWPDTPIERDALLEASGYTTGFAFNALGELKGQTDARGNHQRFAHTVDGQLRELSLLQANTATATVLVRQIQYNAHGQITAQTAGNGALSAFEYCPRDGRLIRVHTGALQDLNYTYDLVGNIVSIEDRAQVVRHFSGQRIDPVNRYTYDSLYQLVHATGREAGCATQGPGHLTDPQAVANYQQTYRYDAGGNLLALTHVGPQSHSRLLVADECSNRCLPAKGHRLTFADGFDENGNLLALDNARTLAWDLHNQLAHVRSVQRDEADDDWEHYVYGADGMRQRKVHSRQTHASTVISETRYFPGLELRCHSATGDTLHLITAQAGRNTVQVLHWAGDTPKGVVNDHYRYTLADHLGSCSLELDSDARVISRETYHPFGTTAFSDTGNSSETSYRTLRYSGKELDATGLYYYGRRYYMPWLQRWVSTDPAGNKDGINLYRMVRNNPVTFHDAWGTESVREYFDEKDVEGFSSVFSAMKTGLQAQGINPSKVLYVMVGRSPQVLGEFISQQGYSTALLQVSGLGKKGSYLRRYADLSVEEQNNRARFIESAFGGKEAGGQGVVMIDYSVSGNSISQVRNMVADYYSHVRKQIPVKMAVVTRYTDSPDLEPGEREIYHSENNILYDQSMRQGFLSMKERGVLRYLKIQHAEIDKGLSYTRKFPYADMDSGKQATVELEGKYKLGVMMSKALEQYCDVSAQPAKNIKRGRYLVGVRSSGINGVETYIKAHNNKRQPWFKRLFG